MGDDDVRVQKIRAWTGALVVAVGDAAIAASAVWGILQVEEAESSVVVGILSSAFTAIAAITTAYFGIRAATDAAQSATSAAQSA
jgi:hypothetical protein